MRDEILEALITMVQGLVSMPVAAGSIPPDEGYAIGLAGGGPLETFRTLESNQSLPIVFNGKSSNQQTVSSEMDAVHFLLTQARNLPFSDTWQIYAIETTSAPQLIGREQNQNWVYGSSFQVKFYARRLTNA